MIYASVISKSIFHLNLCHKLSTKIITKHISYGKFSTAYNFYSYIFGKSNKQNYINSLCPHTVSILNIDLKLTALSQFNN